MLRGHGWAPWVQTMPLKMTTCRGGVTMGVPSSLLNPTRYTMSPRYCLELFVIQDKDTKQSFPSWACLGNLPPLSSPNPHPSWLLDSPQVHTSPPSPSLHAQGVRSLSQLISLHFYTHLKYPYLYIGLPWPSLAVSFLKTAHCVSLITSLLSLRIRSVCAGMKHFMDEYTNELVHKHTHTRN